MKIHAAIFDMDGLLLDTERVCMQVFRQSCTHLNLPFFEQTYLSMIGRNAAGIDEVLRTVYGEDLDALHADWKKHYDAIVEHQAIPIKQGAIELLTWLKQQQLPIAVATSTHRATAQIKLRLAGLDQYIDELTCGCEVTKGKPDPEIYLLAAKRLNINPVNCLALEDSNNGVRSAVSAKMTTFQIPDLVQPCRQIKALGHQIVPSLHAVLDHLKQHHTGL
ncbi:HAD family hydrolase [Vibrio ostreicida]|uniref:HAD family hydrolase n=1 Tax=Vibrio ostreicida TaxID=526588 RepID=UPI0009706ABD|nr:HAD family phosphatase [Vibrio ostreicida]